MKQTAFYLVLYFVQYFIEVALTFLFLRVTALDFLHLCFSFNKHALSFAFISAFL